MYTHILVATDGSEQAERASEHALGLARSLNARVTAVSVFPPWAKVALRIHNAQEEDIYEHAAGV